MFFCELVFSLCNLIKLSHQSIIFFLDMSHFLLLLDFYQILFLGTFFGMVKYIVGKFFLGSSEIASRTYFIDPS